MEERRAEGWAPAHPPPSADRRTVADVFGRGLHAAIPSKPSGSGEGHRACCRRARMRWDPGRTSAHHVSGRRRHDLLSLRGAIPHGDWRALSPSGSRTRSHRPRPRDVTAHDAARRRFRAPDVTDVSQARGKARSSYPLRGRAFPPVPQQRRAERPALQRVCEPCSHGVRTVTGVTQLAKKPCKSSPLTDSNRRPPPYHGGALPTELRGRERTRYQALRRVVSRGFAHSHSS